MVGHVPMVHRCSFMCTIHINVTLHVDFAGETTFLLLTHTKNIGYFSEQIGFSVLHHRIFRSDSVARISLTKKDLLPL